MTSKSGYIGSLSPEYVLLGFLVEQPNHGYELHLRLAAELNHIWHVSQSQVDNILKRLEMQGDITGAVQEQEKLHSRLLYELTPAGRRRFEAWLDTPTRCSVRAIRVELITRLYFVSCRSSSRADALIDSQVEETRKGLARLQGMLIELLPGRVFNCLGLELRTNQLSSILDWLEKCRTVTNRQNDFPKSEQP